MIHSDFTLIYQKYGNTHIFFYNTDDF